VRVVVEHVVADAAEVALQACAMQAGGRRRRASAPGAARERAAEEGGRVGWLGMDGSRRGSS
jgi:hypothetical protein